MASFNINLPDRSRAHAEARNLIRRLPPATHIPAALFPRPLASPRASPPPSRSSRSRSTPPLPGDLGPNSRSDDARFSRATRSFYLDLLKDIGVTSFLAVLSLGVCATWWDQPGDLYLFSMVLVTTTLTLCTVYVSLLDFRELFRSRLDNRRIVRYMKVKEMEAEVDAAESCKKALSTHLQKLQSMDEYIRRSIRSGSLIWDSPEYRRRWYLLSQRYESLIRTVDSEAQAGSQAAD